MSLALHHLVRSQGSLTMLLLLLAGMLVRRLLLLVTFLLLVLLAGLAGCLGDRRR